VRSPTGNAPDPGYVDQSSPLVAIRSSSVMSIMSTSAASAARWINAAFPSPESTADGPHGLQGCDSSNSHASTPAIV
jgi:hypothetical protein